MTDLVLVDELAAAATVREGDEVCWSENIGFCVVSSVSRTDSGQITIVYFKRGEEAWTKGWVHKPWLVERSLRPFDADELIRVRRGDLDRADEVRLQMEQEQQDRWARDAEKAEERTRRDRQARNEELRRKARGEIS